MPYQAVFFDLGGVIVRTEYQAPRQHLAERLGMEYEDLVRAVFDSETARRASLGEISEVEHWSMLARRFRRQPSEIDALRGEFFGGDIAERKATDRRRSAVDHDVAAEHRRVAAILRRVGAIEVIGIAERERQMGDAVRVEVDDPVDPFGNLKVALAQLRPGDAARGKQAFQTKGCAGCHSVSGVAGSGPKAVVTWKSLNDPILLAQEMWNHAALMKEALEKKRITWPRLTSQELTDILVYLQNLPETRKLAANFSFPPSDTGAQLFQSKGCAGCHTGRMALESRLHNQTLTGIADLGQPDQIRSVFVSFQQYLYQPATTT